METNNSTRLIDNLENLLNRINSILDRATYYDEPATTEHMQEIQNELKRIMNRLT